MNIIAYTHSVCNGGVNTVTETLCNHLNRRGHHVVRLLQRRHYNDSRDFVGGGIYLPNEEPGSYENVDFYHHILKERNIDVVINQEALFGDSNWIYNTAGLNTAVISVLHSNPALILEHLFSYITILKDNTFIEKIKRVGRVVLYSKIRRQFYNGRKSQYQMLYKAGSHIVVLSPGFIPSVQRFVPEITNISAIGNPNTYSTVNVVPKEKIVLSVGRLNNLHKNILPLFSIWAQVQSRQSSWKLIIVGEGPDEDMLRQKAEGIPNIEFVGRQDPRPYYEKASILCMTSVSEGWGMVLTEAMQHGCVPMAYGSFAAVFDIITSGVDGEIIKPFNKKEYTRRLLHLINDSEYRNTLAANAKESVRRFDVDKIMDQWEKLLEKTQCKIWSER